MDAVDRYSLGTFHLHPDVWLLVAVLFLGYRYLTRRESRRRGEESVTPKQRRLFYGGVAALWIGADWPIHDLAEESLYSAHMLQHMIFTLLAAPLMLCGTPAWLFRRLVKPRPLHFVVRHLSRPLPALLFSNAVLVFTHWPLLVGKSIGSEPLHLALHTLIFASAIILWMPVASPVIEIPRASYPGQMVYLFLQSLVPTVPASFLTFGTEPLYKVYETMPKLWGMSALTDQRTAGLMMKIVGGFVLWGVITALFFKWYKIEHSEGVDVLAFHNIDRELNRGMTR